MKGPDTWPAQETEMRRRAHERDAATDPESSERDARFGPDTVFRMRGSFRGPPGDSGPRARPTTALTTHKSNREGSPARTGPGKRKRGHSLIDIGTSIELCPLFLLPAHMLSAHT